MDRRFLTVLGVSLVFALMVSAVFYRVMSADGPRKVENSELKDVVVAAKALPVGVSVKPADLRLAKVPVGQFPKGAFSKVEDVIERPVISNILMDEPILEGRLAVRGSGMGLAPIIPVGMRAVSVRVNEVVGVAGFVLPGMRVDVLVTGRPPNESAGTMTTTVLQNILVLSAGQTIQSDPRGQAINAPVVTLLVTPEQAEICTLAGNEGRIQLVLRNGKDEGIEKTPGREVAELFGVRRKASPAPAPRPAAPKQPVTVVAMAPPPPPPPDEVVMFRGTVKTVEPVAARRNQN